MNTDRIALFGGSFDPPHKGHLAIIKSALEQLDIDKLIIVPSYLNPLKKGFVAPPEKRLEWVRKMVEGFDKVEICTFEIDNDRPTYSIETVLFLKRSHDKIYFIIGADNLKSLNQWHRYEKLEQEVTFVVATRDKIPIPESFMCLQVDVPISSTELREGIKKKHIPENIADEVYRYYHGGKSYVTN